MRKPAFCICENKDAEKLCSNTAPDHCFCFRYIDSTIPLLPKVLKLSSVVVQPSFDDAAHLSFHHKNWQNNYYRAMIQNAWSSLIENKLLILIKRASHCSF